MVDGANRFAVDFKDGHAGLEVSSKGGTRIDLSDNEPIGLRGETKLLAKLIVDHTSFDSVDEGVVCFRERSVGVSRDDSEILFLSISEDRHLNFGFGADCGESETEVAVASDFLLVDLNDEVPVLDLSLIHI